MTAAEKLINDCVSPFNEHQRQMLRDLSDVREGNKYTEVNRRLEDYIETLRDMYPEMFHTDKTLKHRVFMDEPRVCMDEPRSLSMPFARFVRAWSQSPIQQGNK
jgi:hypothetical protein